MNTSNESSSNESVTDEKDYDFIKKRKVLAVKRYREKQKILKNEAPINRSIVQDSIVNENSIPQAEQTQFHQDDNCENYSDAEPEQNCRNEEDTFSSTMDSSILENSSLEEACR